MRKPFSTNHLHRSQCLRFCVVKVGRPIANESSAVVAEGSTAVHRVDDKIVDKAQGLRDSDLQGVWNKERNVENVQDTVKDIAGRIIDGASRHSQRSSPPSLAVYRYRCRENKSTKGNHIGPSKLSVIPTPCLVLGSSNTHREPVETSHCQCGMALSGRSIPELQRCAQRTP